MSVQIRKATPTDFPGILALVHELAAFQHSPEKVKNSVPLMQEEAAYFEGFVAETAEGEIIGMAIYCFAYYTWVGKSLYLDDLYVKEQYRGQKIGGRLLEQLFEVARKENCKRVRWLVAEWNKPAIEFYKKCGAAIDAGFQLCDFDYHTIQEFRI